MKIGIIGHDTRGEEPLRHAAVAAGHQVDFYSPAGRARPGARAVSGFVKKLDALLIVERGAAGPGKSAYEGARALARQEGILTWIVEPRSSRVEATVAEVLAALAAFFSRPARS